MSVVAAPSGPVSTAPQGSAVAGPHQKRARYPLDAIRALAALAVVVYHAYQNNVELYNGYSVSPLASSAMEALASSVDLFFVLSGFLFWLPISKAALAGRKPGSGRVMLRRRIVRLIPAYYVIVFIAWIVANPSVQRGNYADLLLHLSFTQIYSPQMIFYTVGPAWSLAIEFHFYVFIAISMWFVGALAVRASTQRRRLLVALSLPTLLVVGGAFYLLWAIVLDPQPANAWTVWFSAPSKAADFGVGMLLAVAVACGITVRPALRRLALTGAVVLVAAAVLLCPAVTPIERQWAHLVYAGAALLAIGAVVTNSGSQPKWLTSRLLVYLGTLSYSLYLVHEFVMQALRNLGLLPSQGSALNVAITAALVIVVATGAAILLHRFVELPAQRIGDIWERKQEVPEPSPSGPPSAAVPTGGPVVAARGA